MAQTRMVVCAEAVTSEVAASDAVVSRLGGALRERLGLSCEVVLAAPGQLPRTEVGKARRLVRWESGEPPIPGLR
jgi:phenylacetate-CoA ligase